MRDGLEREAAEAVADSKTDTEAETVANLLGEAPVCEAVEGLAGGLNLPAAEL